MAEVVRSDERTSDPSDFGALRPGTRLGRYELLVPIARGGMARVWAARQHGQRGFQKLVAIKTILPHLADDPEFERMFLDEARIASGVHHPNVCEIYELGEERRTLYLAMEWVNGDSLSRVLRPSGKNEPIDPRVASRIIADACAGAHAAHELTDEDERMLGVVHRDLSPHNVLLTADGLAKVCDFGVAKAFGQLHEQTSAGQLKGKLSYMAPEQVTGDPVDRRSDVFSLGCVLYEATTGVRPFKGEGDHQVMQAIVNGEIEPPSRVVRTYPPELERIVMRALALHPNRRFGSAELMRYALEEMLTRGSLVTQSHVAQLVRSRVGDLVDERREKIKQASSAAEQPGWDASGPLSARGGARDHRSGVKATRVTVPEAAAIRHDPAVELFRPARPAEASSSTLPHAMEVPSPADGATPELGVPVVRESSSFLDGLVRAAEGSGEAVFPATRVHAVASDPPESRPPPRSVAPRDLPRDVPIPIVSPLAPSELGPPAALFAGAGASSGHAGAGSAGAGQYAVAALGGLILAMAIGGGIFYFWSAREAPADAALSAATTSAPSPASAAVKPMGSLGGASAELLFRSTPADAVLVVDGRELPRDQRTVPRPAAGRTTSIAVRAKGYEEANLQVDYFSAPAVDIVLKPLPVHVSQAAAPGTPTTPTTTNAVSSKPKPKPRQREPSGKEKDPGAIPDNPY